MTTAPDASTDEYRSGQGTRQSSASIGELFSDVSKDISTLFRQEVELAKAEVRESATNVGKGAGLLSGAGVAAHLGLVFLSIALWWTIGNGTGRGWAALIVAAVYLVVAAVMALVGRRELKAVGVPKTKSTVKEIPAALKGEDAR